MVITEEYEKMIVNVDAEWQKFLDHIKEAEKMIDNCKDSFKLNLLGEAKELKNTAKQLLEKLSEIPTTQDT